MPVGLAPPRMIAVWCPDWPVTAAAAAAGNVTTAAAAGNSTAAAAPVRTDQTPIAVVTANRVVACSELARTAGVRRGQRRREAQARCPELAVLARNEAAE